MARAKPKWRKVLNARFLRWWTLGCLVRMFPTLGRRFAFFPDHIDMVAGADQVLADDVTGISPDSLSPHMDFLTRCEAHDSRAPGIALPDGAVTGRRTALYRNAWVDMNNGSVLLPDRAKTVLVRGEVANWNATSARWARDRVQVDGRVFAPLITHNYFHVMLENAVRVLDLLDSGLIDDQPLTIAMPNGRTRVEDAFYKGLKALYPNVSIRQVSKGALVEADAAVLHFPPDNYWEWPPVTPAAAQRLSEVFDKAYGTVAPLDVPKLYLSRAGAKLRDPVNSAALAEALQAKGFHDFTASDQNHADQIAHFRAAKTVISVHGAGLTNLIFCAPGTKVIEIFPSNFVKSPYWRLAQQLDLDYRSVIGGPGDYDQRFEVDIEAVLTALEDA